MIQRRTNTPRSVAIASAPPPAKQSAAPPQQGEVPWRERANLSLQTASEVLGVSVASLYRLEAEGSVRFRRVGSIVGRTLVVTEDVVRLADGGEAWTPSDLGHKARARRAELAANGWKEVAA